MKKIKKNLKKIIIIVLAVLILLTVWLIWENKSLTVTEYTVASDRLPEGFSGFRIAQISDLHNTEFGADNKRLITQLEKIAPDIIVITGDLIDSRRTNIDVAVSFAEQAAKIAPTYYVSGNHERGISDEDYNKLIEGLISAGVTVLEDSKIYIERGGDNIALIGISDPTFSDVTEKTDYGRIPTNEKLQKLSGADDYLILLFHRPEMLDIYAQNKIDLALTGHAHGGQVRLPFIGGLYSPGQGIFPKYDAGLFNEDGTAMIISRGLGNSRALIPRINNRPEIVVVELVKGE